MFGFFSKNKDDKMKKALMDITSKMIDDDLDHTVANIKYSMEEYDEMLNDEQIKASTSFKKVAVLSSGWEIQSPQNEKEDWKVTEFVKSVIKDMRTPLNVFLESAMSAHDYGFSITEKIYKRRTDGLIGYDRMLTRRPHDFVINTDDSGYVINVTQDTDDGELEIDARKLVVYSYGDPFGSVYGQSDLNTARRAYLAKKEAYRLMSIFLKKESIPPIFAYFNPDSYKEDFAIEMKAVLKKLQSASIGLLPRGVKEDLEILDLKSNRNVSAIFIPAMEMYDKHISKSLLMPSLVDFNTQSGGSYAQSRTGLQMLMMIVEKIKTADIETEIMMRQFIKPIVDINFAGIKNYPEFKFIPYGNPDMLNIIDRWSSLTGTQAVSVGEGDENHLRGMLGFPLVSNHDRIPPKPAPEKQKAFSRNFSVHEDKEKLEKTFETLTNKIDNASFDFVKSVSSDYKSLIKKYKGNIKKISALKLDTKQFEKDMLLLINESGKAGAKDLNEVSKKKLKEDKKLGNMSVFKADSFLTEAKDWANVSAFRATQSVSEPVIKSMRDLLLKALINGMPNDELDAQMALVMSDYSKKGVKSGLIRTISQNAMTASYNQGRIVEARSSDDVIGLRYQAILDGQETEVCEGLDELEVDINSQDVDTFSPPNHHGCRSLWSPIMFYEKKPDGLSSKQRTSAESNAGKGFV